MCCSSLLKLKASACGLLWLSDHILHVSRIKSTVKEADELISELDLELILRPWSSQVLTARSF